MDRERYVKKISERLAYLNQSIEEVALQLRVADHLLEGGKLKELYNKSLIDKFKVFQALDILCENGIAVRLENNHHQIIHNTDLWPMLTNLAAIRRLNKYKTKNIIENPHNLLTEGIAVKFQLIVEQQERYIERETARILAREESYLIQNKISMV